MSPVEKESPAQQPAGLDPTQDVAGLIGLLIAAAAGICCLMGFLYPVVFWVASGARVDHSVLWDGVVVEEDARVEGAIVISGGVVRRGQTARDVVILPRRALRRDTEAGGRVQDRDGMAWVELK